MPDNQTQNPVQQHNTGDPLLQKEVDAIEKELLNEIIIRLKENRMTPEEAQRIAKDFLVLLPFHDQKDLLEKLKKLSQNNLMLSGIYLHYAAPQEEADRQKKLELMSKHLQDGNIEHAIAVAKGDASHAS